MVGACACEGSTQSRTTPCERADGVCDAGLLMVCVCDAGLLMVHVCDAESAQAGGNGVSVL